MFENPDALVHPLSNDVHLAEMTEQGDIVGLFAPQLLQQRDCRRRLSGQEVRRGIFQPHGKPTPELQHLVGPRIGPHRLAGFADRERELRFFNPADAAVRRTEQLQRVTIARVLHQGSFEDVNRPRFFVPLQVDARQSGCGRDTIRIEPGGVRKCPFRAAGVVPIEQPLAEPPVGGCVRGTQLDGTANISNRIVRSTEPRLDVRQAIPPLRIRAVERRRNGVGVTSGADDPVRFAGQAELAPS